MSAVRTEMEATVDKCLAFCQALVSSNQKFTFAISIGKETFKFDNKELVASSCVTKKKKSPSQIRREDRRREARKSKITEEVVQIPPVITPQNHEATEKAAVPKQKSAVLAFKCEQCDYTSTSEKGLKQHARMKHRTSQVGVKTNPSPARETDQPPPFELNGGLVYCDKCDGCLDLDVGLDPFKCTTDCGLNHYHKQYPGDDFVWAFRHRDSPGDDILHCLVFCPPPPGCPCCQVWRP